MTMLRRAGRMASALVLVVSLSGCALFISDPEERAEVIETNDPIEGVNRHIFAINLALDTFILRPVSVLYREFVPTPGQEMVRNFVHNLKLPFTAINDLLQGEPERAETAMSRFLVNSTAGVGGLFDAATGLGLEYHEEDFGQTLAVHGSEEGPYLMLPIFGPSNLRDAIGLVVQYFTDPVGIAADEAGADSFGFVRGGMEAVDSRARHLETFDTLQEQSLDFYAAVRSLYRQRRAAEIRNFEGDAVPGRPFAQMQSDAETPPGREVAQVPVTEPGYEPAAVVPTATPATATVSGIETVSAATAPTAAIGAPSDKDGAIALDSTPQATVAPEIRDTWASSDRPLDPPSQRNIWVPANGTPDLPPARTSRTAETQLAESVANDDPTGRFERALRDFEEAARTFDEMARTPPE